MFDSNNYRKQVLKPLLDNGRPDTDDPFTLFDIELAEDDTAKIKARIDEVIAFWRKEQSSPRYRNLVTTLLKDRESLAQTLLDPAARRAGRQRIDSKRHQQSAAQFQHIDEMLAKLNNRWGGIPSSRLERLRAAANRAGVTVAEFDQRLRGFTIIDDSGTATAAAPPREVRQQARGLLIEFSHLNDDEPKRSASTLFDFIGVEPDAARATISSARDRIGARNRQRRHDRLRTVVDELLALVTDLLLEGSNATYIAGLVADAADSIRPEVETALLVEDRLTSIEFERLLRIVIAAGIEPATARSAVLNIAREVGIAVETGQTVDYVVCSSCRAANPTGVTVRRCEQCGADLYMDCPGCGQPVARSAAICRSCSYDVAALRLVEQAVTEARKILASGGVLDAAEVVDGLEAWANDIAAVHAVRAEIDRAHQDAVGKWAAGIALLGQGRLDEAAAAGQELQRSARDVSGPDGQSAEAFCTEVATALGTIRAEVAATAALDGIERERAVLTLAGRYPTSNDVLTELRHLPVTAPSRVMAMISSDTVKITWKPSPSPGPVTYRVTRLILDRDGEHSRPVGSTSETALEDGGAVAGSVVSYEVQAVRHGIQSGRVRTRAQLVAFEVARLAAVEHDGSIELRWTRMVGHDAIWVERTNLSDPSDPTRRTSASDSGWMDTNVTADHRYSYRVFVEYLDGHERTATSGRTITATAFVAPDAPALSLVRSSAAQMTFRGSGPGALNVARCMADPQLAAGTIVAAGRVERLGVKLPVDANGFASDRVDGNVVWYLPWAVFSNQAVVGPALLHPGIGDIANLTAHLDEARVVVRWDWPSGCTEALIAWMVGAAPTAVNDERATTAKVTNTNYSINSGWALKDPPVGELHFLVRPARRLDGVLVAVPGAPERALVTCIVGEPTALSYSVRRIGRRKRELQVDIAAPGAVNLPRLLVVAHPADGTAGSDDGEVLGVVPSGSSSVVVRFDGLRLPAIISVRVEQGHSSRLRINAPPAPQRTIS